MSSTDDEKMRRLDALFSHVWMVRTFLKHAEETEEDDELADVPRMLYDVMLALGPPLRANDPAAYLKACRKKRSRLLKATELFAEIQPEISDHTNFQMALASLRHAVAEIDRLLEAE